MSLFMLTTLSIDTVKVKRLLIYQMLKVRDNIRMNMYQHRKDRLLALIDTQYGGQRVRFCDRTGLSESRLAQLLSQTYRDGEAFTEKTARKVEMLAGLPELYFDQGPVEVTASAAPVQSGFRPIQVAGPDDPRLTLIPKVQLKLSAGIMGFEVEPQRFDGSTITVPTDWIARNGYDPMALLATDVGGQSMEPTLYHGDLVVVNTADKRPVDGVVFAFNYEGEPVIKRLTRDAGRWWLTSDNPDQQKYPRKICEGDACIIVGRIVRKESDHI